MLHLKARVGLHEVEAPAGIHQELEGAGVRVLHRFGRVDDDGAHAPSHLVAERDRRRFLEQLLVPALDGALALAEMNHGAVMVPEHLELDVARRLDVFFDVHVADAERRFGFALCRLHRM